MSPEIELGSIDETIGEDAMRRLVVFLELLKRWNRTINLVSSASLKNSWNRHVLDSAQLFQFARNDQTVWGDLGSGGGFPGIVVAAMAASRFPGLQFRLIEADQRKAAFLRTVSRETDLAVEVVNERIEFATPLCADVVSARALAPLSKLCGFASMHLRAGGKALFIKGAQVEPEVALARLNWGFGLTIHKSLSGGDGCVLELDGISHA